MHTELACLLTQRKLQQIRQGNEVISETELEHIECKYVHSGINNNWLIDCRMFRPHRPLSTASSQQHSNEPYPALIQLMQWTLTMLVHTLELQPIGTHLHGSRRETLLPWATTSCDLSVLVSKLAIGSVSLLLLMTSFVRVSHILQTWGRGERCQHSPGTPPSVTCDTCTV